jgi:ankyrin repeat protein
MSFKLHRLVRLGDLEQVEELLKSSGQKGVAVNEYDKSGRTPLMHAVISPKASIDLMRLLLDHGADIHLETREPAYVVESVMALALQGGDPAKVLLLLQRGANIHYERAEGYSALLDAVHGRDVLRDQRLIDLLRLLISHRVNLNAVSTYQESGCRVLSRIGRFDAVRLLLEAGADPEHLKWTPLMRAVALGSLADMLDELARTSSLEEKDWWERTAWLLAIQTGEVAKACLLLERGADRNARGRCQKLPLFYAIETFHTSMLRWLLEIGMPVEDRDQFGGTPLTEAVEHSNLDAVNDLLDAGADVNAEYGGQVALSFVRTREIAERLLGVGANPHHLPNKGRRALLGFAPDPDEDILDISPSDFRAGRVRRFGIANPEKFDSPYCEGMIRAGLSASQAAEIFRDSVEPVESPVWCAQRFGQSLTFLPDGRAIQIAGEHEDYYDRNFCIYNDVFVHEPGGAIHIFGYPEAVFPPTDFHSATLLGLHIYLIGSLGYMGQRRHGATPVYRLDTDTFKIEEIILGGDKPGWIFSHTAVSLSSHEISISGGTVVTWDGEQEIHAANERSFILDIERAVWTACP